MAMNEFNAADLRRRKKWLKDDFSEKLSFGEW
jgi:hypothetical protein